MSILSSLLFALAGLLALAPLYEPSLTRYVRRVYVRLSSHLTMYRIYRNTRRLCDAQHRAAQRILRAHYRAAWRTMKTIR